MDLTQYLESLDSEDLIDVYEHIMRIANVSVIADEANIDIKNWDLRKGLTDSVFYQVRKRMRLVHGSELLDAITNDYKEKFRETKYITDALIGLLPKRK